MSIAPRTWVTGLLCASFISLGAASSAFAATAPAHAPVKHHAVARHHAGLSHAQVKRIQTALDKAGAKVRVDGVWGKQTEAALREFQRHHHLRATGRLDRATEKQLHGA